MMKKMLIVVLMALVFSCVYAENKSSEIQFTKADYMAELVGLTKENYRLRKDLTEKKAIIRQLSLRLTRLSISYQTFKKEENKVKKISSIERAKIYRKNKKIKNLEYRKGRLLSSIAGWKELGDKIKSPKYSSSPRLGKKKHSRKLGGKTKYSKRLGGEKEYIKIKNVIEKNKKELAGVLQELYELKNL